MSHDNFLEHIADTGGWIALQLESVADDITVRLHGQANTLEVFQNSIEDTADMFRRAGNQAADTLDDDVKDPDHDGFATYEDAYTSLRELAYEEPDGNLPHDDRSEWEDAAAALQDVFEDDRVKKP